MGAYSPYPREINIYFLQGGVYILYRESSVRGRRNEKKTRENEETREPMRKREQNGAFARYSGIFADRPVIWSEVRGWPMMAAIPFSGEI